MEMNWHRYLLALWVSVVVNGCDSEQKIILSFPSEEAKERSIKELKSNRIWFQRIDDDRIKTRQSDENRLRDVIQKVVSAIMPFERSLGVNKHIQPRLLQLLDKEGVQYKIVVFGENALPYFAEEVGMTAEYIVFEEGHGAEGFQVWEKLKYSSKPEDFMPPGSAANRQLQPTEGG